jgi:hypothetical protein
MTIGRHECKNARDTRLKEAIFISLDEALTALEESFYDLTDEQVWSFPAAGKNNIAWIVMHCLDNLDEYLNGAQTGERLFPTEWRWDLWQCKPEERPKPGDPFPTAQEMLERLRKIRDAGMATLEHMDESAMTDRLGSHPHKTLRSDWYMRTLYHTNSHVRQIWLLRGALGLVNGPWPEQHWA